jgi:hypothetical protein
LLPYSYFLTHIFSNMYLAKHIASILTILHLPSELNTPGQIFGNKLIKTRVTEP